MSFSASGGIEQWRLTFELSPIYLTGNSPVVSNYPGGIVPLIELTEANSLLGGGVFDPAAQIGSPDFFAHFVPLPGATVIDNQIATYPFANQAVAANALITQPLQISMKMICPVRDPGGYWSKLSVMSRLQATLDQHNTRGGTYTIVTPSFFYTNAIMTGMRDVSGGGGAQAQHTWQLDFLRPLLTLEAAAAAQNNLMSKLSDGSKVTNPSWSGAATTVGRTSPDAPVPIGSGGAGSNTVGPGGSAGLG